MNRKELSSSDKNKLFEKTWRNVGATGGKLSLLTAVNLRRAWFAPLVELLWMCVILYIHVWMCIKLSLDSHTDSSGRPCKAVKPYTRPDPDFSWPHTFKANWERGPSFPRRNLKKGWGVVVGGYHLAPCTTKPFSSSEGAAKKQRGQRSKQPQAVSPACL